MTRESTVGLRGGLRLALLSAAVIAGTVAAPGGALLGETRRVSVDSSGAQGSGSSGGGWISADGRYVAFHSAASNLVANDTNGKVDVFVHDRQTGATSLVSVAPASAGANGDSAAGPISADGRFVAFHSLASNLVPGDTNPFRDVFVHDRDAGTTTRVSLDSFDGQANGPSEGPSISADGRFVAFTSTASNLVGGDTNATYDVFVKDLQTRETARVSVSSAGLQGNAGSADASISADGRFVAFTSSASNLVDDDTNGTADVFVHDRQAGTTARIAVGGRPAISADGRFVAFSSQAANLVPGDTNSRLDVFVHDRTDGTTARVSVTSAGAQANDNSFAPSISADGRFVAFTSSASNLGVHDVNFAPDVFVHDRLTAVTEQASVDGAGNGGDLESAIGTSLTADGRAVAFASRASNLVPDDTNGVSDVFVRGAPPIAPDTTPPVLSVPAGVVADATGCAGAAITYDVSAVDDTDPAPGVSCSPASGTSFPIGITTVQCTATDAAGNAAAASFTVTVRGAVDQLNDLIARVQDLNAKQGIVNSLDAKLQAAREALDAARAGDASSACGKLEAFSNEVRAQSGQAITEADAEFLIAAASRIAAVICCANEVP